MVKDIRKNNIVGHADLAFSTARGIPVYMAASSQRTGPSRTSLHGSSVIRIGNYIYSLPHTPRSVLYIYIWLALAISGPPLVGLTRAL